MLPTFSWSLISLIRMIVKSRTPPEYRDTFLKNAAQALLKRRKAINFHGNLEFSYDFEDSFEWITVCYSSFNYPSLILQLVEGGKISFFVRSNRRMDRGRVLLKIENLRVVKSEPLLSSAPQ
jgi:hypothetical protein